MEHLRQAFSLLAVASAVFTVGFSFYALHAAQRLLRPASSGRGARPQEGPAQAPARPLPPITILKPVKGVDREMYANMASFLDQDYPRLQVVFCVQDAGDRALPVLRKLKEQFGRRAQIDIVVSGGSIGYNPKINNLANAASLILHDLLMISDSDVRVEPDFLRRVVRGFDDPRVGLATCFYQSRRAFGPGALLEALSVNTHFLPQTLAAVHGGMRFAMGAVMLMRRSAFERAGGFEVLSRHLADDYVLGAILQEQGWRVEVMGPVVTSVPDDWSVGEHLRHLVRWSRTIRLCRPAGYLGSGILHGFSLLCLDILCNGPGPAAWRLKLLALVATSRLWTVARIHLCCTGNREILRQLPLLPLGDLIQFGAWLGGFRSRRVHWRGEVYSIHANGRLAPSSEAELAKTLAAAA